MRVPIITMRAQTELLTFWFEKEQENKISDFNFVYYLLSYFKSCPNDLLFDSAAAASQCQPAAAASCKDQSKFNTFFLFLQGVTVVKF